VRMRKFSQKPGFLDFGVSSWGFRNRVSSQYLGGDV
jgi:hypothetical protein